MNYHYRLFAFITVTSLISGCDNKPDLALSPPSNAKWVEVAFKTPDGMILQPAELLYRSEKCKTVRYNSSNEPHNIRGYNDTEKHFSTQTAKGVQTLRVALEGGGSCQWSLNSLRISFKLKNDNPLTFSKDVIDTNYIFDFDDYGLSDGYGTGEVKNFHGDINIKTDFFPSIFINKMFNKTTLRFFGGDTKHHEWSRRYMVIDANYIKIEPAVHYNLPVKIESPNPPPGNFVATYPDGSTEEIPNIYPDYKKLISMK